MDQTIEETWNTGDWGEHKKNKQGLFILKVREQEPKEENAMP